MTEKRKPGRPRVDNHKVQIAIRLDPALVERLRATGRGWHGRIEKLLADAYPPAEIKRIPVKVKLRVAAEDGVQVGPAPIAPGSRLKTR